MLTEREKNFQGVTRLYVPKTFGLFEETPSKGSPNYRQQCCRENSDDIGSTVCVITTTAENARSELTTTKIAACVLTSTNIDVTELTSTQKLQYLN